MTGPDPASGLHRSVVVVAATGGRGGKGGERCRERHVVGPCHVSNPHATPPVSGEDQGAVPQISTPVSTRAKILARDSGWQLGAQLAPLVVNLAFTPFVIHQLGPVAYGFWLITSALAQFFSQFDGGIGRSAQRYFTVYAGRADRTATTRLLVTLLVCVLAVTALTLVPCFLLAGRVVDFFHSPPEYRDDTVLLLRVFVALVGLGLARNLFASILGAYQRFALTSATVLMGYAVYAGIVVWALPNGLGLRGIAIAQVAQQLLATLTIVPAACRYLSKSGIGFISWPDLKEFIVFAWKVQLSGLLSLVSLQAETLLVGRLAPNQVSSFGPGATFAHQLRLLPMNAVSPIQAMLGRAVGANGAAAATADFEQIQRLWVTVVCGWVASGAPAAFFGVNAWLPLPGPLPGAVAAILTTAHLFVLLPQVLMQWAMLMGRPQYEVWASALAFILSILLSLIAIPFFGALAVALATLIGQCCGFVMLQIAARRLPVTVTSPFRVVPWIPTILTAAVSALSGYLVHLLLTHLQMPKGPLGLLLSGLAAAPALLGYVWVTVGPSRLRALLRGRVAAPR